VVDRDVAMVSWQDEIKELHDVFEAYFLGTIETLDRVEQVLADDFTIVGPDGIESTRAMTIQALRAAHGHIGTLAIKVTDAALVVENGDILVARYVENHHLADRTNRRLSTVVFTRLDTAPNGLEWRRVHETWLP
jgi:hypothetical protein